MKEIVLGIWLGVQGGLDWKYKEIPLWVSLLGGSVGVGICILEERMLVDILLACMPGIITLIFSKLTKEVIGYGDGIVFTAMGFYLSLKELISIGMLAFLIAGIVAMILLVIFRKNGNYRIAFLPFLEIAYLIHWWMKEGGGMC